MTDSSQWQRLNALHHQIAAIDSEIAHLFQERLLLAEGRSAAVSSWKRSPSLRP